ncbi:MAG: inorganic phosphate transporter [Clostridia bacterium]|nr:inorganic phosphate transporter [Clostridia bacterium]
MNFLYPAIFLTLGVIFVNGWTDAPNAIVSCVCSKTFSMKKAVLLASVCNFLGVFIISLINTSVAKNVFEVAKITDRRAICAALLSVIVLAVGAWTMGIPTSESHAIIASLIGAGLATRASIDIKTISYSLIGLFLSVTVGFLLGYHIYGYWQKKIVGKKKLMRMQVFGAAFMAFMHGAQDGQKFISIILLITGVTGEFGIPLWAAVLCSFVMGLGTMAGGGRIIRKVGEQMVELNLKQGVSADIAGGISLLLSTFFGLPVSTTHVKTSAVMGCGYVSGGLSKKTASEMLAAWVITFPACFGMGYIFTKIFLKF